MSQIARSGQGTKSAGAAQARSKAERTILETLNISTCHGIGDFCNHLKQAIESLPQYKVLETAMKQVASEQLAYELFKTVRKATDDPIRKAGIPQDGVLINSIRQGHVECAGRTFIASTYLQKRAYPHAVVEAPAHSFLLLESDADTLAYCDANKDLFFTFPRVALQGYNGLGQLSECNLQRYVPRQKDFFDGWGMVYREFLTMSAQEGVARQYLASVKAALAKLKEFDCTPIPRDLDAAGAMDEITKDILGPEDLRLRDYYQKDTGMLRARETEAAAVMGMFNTLLESENNNRDLTDASLATIAEQCCIWFPYLGNQLLWLGQGAHANSLPLKVKKRAMSM